MPLHIERLPDALRLGRRAEEIAVSATLKTVRALKAHLKPDGDMVGRGGTYSCAPTYAQQCADRGLVEILGDQANPIAVQASGSVVAAVEETLGEWTLAISPAEYLERYGEDKKHSKLALALVAAAAASTPEPGAE